MHYLYKLLTYDHQICTDTYAPTDIFTCGLTYFSRSQESKCKNRILGQPGWHKSLQLHTEACNLAYTDLLMNIHRIPKTRSGWPTLRVKTGRRKMGGSDIFKPAELHSPCNVCYFLTSCGSLSFGVHVIYILDAVLYSFSQFFRHSAIEAVQREMKGACSLLAPAADIALCWALTMTSVQRYCSSISGVHRHNSAPSLTTSAGQRDRRPAH